MAPKRAFFSFDFDEAQSLKHHMAGQMRLPTAPFKGADAHLGAPAARTGETE